MITVNLTQAEANALLIQSLGRLDDFRDMMEEAGKNKNTERVLEIAKIIKIIEEANTKLMIAGAKPDWVL